MGKLHDTGKLITQTVHSQNKSRKGFIKAGVAKEMKIMFEGKNRRVSSWIKSIQKKIIEAKVMDKVANSIKKQSSSKSQGLEDATFGQPLNSNSMLERKPFPNQSDFQHGYRYSAEQIKRLFFRTKHPFNNRVQYQGYNKAKRQMRFK